MSDKLIPNDEIETDSRKVEILEGAIGVFLRYGFKKTSMDDVAKSVSISRQALYLYFADKEDLFKEGLRYFFATSFRSAAQILNQKKIPIEEKLFLALEAWLGRYVGGKSSEADDLILASKGLVSGLICSYEEKFYLALIEAIRDSKLNAYYIKKGIGPEQITNTLRAMAQGFKFSCDSDASFKIKLKESIQVICAPIL
ncbi:TetR/AcrR family transcriptional regulator [Leptospira ilyithenensis]|uniref:TetR/AcrR family transcriptional regulator n=1 Tax=Leptospira ilyithenensis TaxID=2484901 RepID=UPI0014383133|nr:TetR/AcrR family transcriptional regulator [Leptospira ilyithenensis]